MASHELTLLLSTIVVFIALSVFYYLTKDNERLLKIIKKLGI